MAKYSDIKGFTVQTLSSDTAASQAAGGSWATGGSLNSTGHASAGGSGSYNAALAIGGEGPPSFSPRYIGLTEQYNGSSWTEVADLNANRAFMGAAGTTTASIASGGNNPGVYPNSALNESWNGSAWTEVNDLNVGNKQFGQAGTATAAFEVGGNNASTSYVSTHEQWDGTNWTESGDINTGRAWGTSFGTTTAAMYAGGRTSSSTPPGVANVESWNGSTWTEVNDLNQARYSTSSSGIQTNGMVFAGYQPPNNLSKTEVFDGTSFTEVGDLGTAVRDAQGANNPSQGIANALSFGGFSTVYSSVTETWTAPSIFTKLTEGQLFFNSTTNTFKESILDIPSGTWASSGNLNQARNILDAQNGTQSSSKASGGSPPGTTGLANVEDYDGSSWSETTEMNTPRYSAAAAGASNTSALVFSGYNNSSPLGSPGGYLSATESWNGSAWTEVNDLNIKMSNRSGNGTQTSALCYGGYESPYALTESWDGTNWTEVSDLNTGRMDLGGIGDSNTSALAFGGLVAPNTKSDKTESWDGTSWTEVNDLNTNRAYVGGSGSRDLAIAFGGETPPLRANTEAWNGTSWTEINDLSTARKSMGSSGSAAAGLAAGGNDGSTVLTATEEFTASLSNKTITTS